MSGAFIVCPSTEGIIKALAESPAGSQWAVGTEIHLIHRLSGVTVEQMGLLLAVPLPACSLQDLVRGLVQLPIELAAGNV